MSGEVVGMVGLGLMGTAIGRNLVMAGYRVVGFDVDPAQHQSFRSEGGEVAGSVSDVVRQAEVIVLSLPHGGIVRDVCLGADGIAGTAREGLVVLDTSTGRPAESIATAEGMSRSGITFMDVTVSGTSAMASSGDLVAMVGGDHDTYERVLPVLAGFTRSQHHLGPVGSGSRAKLVVNLVVGVSRAVLGEALVLGERAGMDMKVMLDVLGDSVAASRVLEVYGPRMVAGHHTDPTGRLSIHAKTIDLILELGREHGVPLWFTETTSRILRIAEADGMGDWDSTATIAVLRKLASGPGDARHPESS